MQDPQARQPTVDPSDADSSLDAGQVRRLQAAVANALTQDDSADAAKASADASRAAATATPPEVGGFRILDTEPLGEGGMGTVYRAEQLHPRRAVALKVIRPMFVSRPMLRRFEFEAEILARLEHNGIARIYAAGTADTPFGPQPYFAMELIRGAPLTRYAAEKHLSVRQKLELLIRVCDAVQFAHQQGVIHRDLKPDNILVTEDGQPKVLDFGVARVTDADVAGATMQTDTGAIVGTLAYMSPEQASGDARSIDTRSDVYALGVIAYEMLSGRLPIAVRGRGLEAALRAVREEEPSLLGTLDRRLAGDVEAIVGKAITKDKRERYASVGALAADLQRHLRHEPISARRPSVPDQVLKFARRNKPLVAVVAIVIASCVAGLIGFAVHVRRLNAEQARTTAALTEAQTQRRKASEEAATAQAVNAFLTDMLSAADPSRQLGEKVTVLDAARQAVRKLDKGSMADRPLVEASVRATIGHTFRALARFDEADPNLRRALELRRQHLPETAPSLVDSLCMLASLCRDRHALPDAERLTREAVELARRGPQGAPPEQLPLVACELAIVLRDLSRYGEAEAILRETLAHLPDGSSTPAVEQARARALNNLGLVLRDQHRFDEALTYYRSALELGRKLYPPGHPELIGLLSNVAQALQESGRAQEAEPQYREAVEMRRRGFPESHPSVARSLDNFAVLLSSVGKNEEALAKAHEALAIRRKVLPDPHGDTATSLMNIAWHLMEARKLDEAERMAREGLAMFRKLYPQPHADTAWALRVLAKVLLEQRRLDEAEATAAEALAMRREVLAPNDPMVLQSQIALAQIWRAKGRHADAEPPIREALAAVEARWGRTSRQTRDVARQLRDVLVALGRTADADALVATYALDASPTTRPATAP